LTDKPNRVQPLPEYYVDLGEPLEEYTQSDNILSRKFQHGEIIVNLDKEDYPYSTRTTAKTLNLEGGGSFDDMGKIIWKDAKDEAVLKSMTAVILRYKQG